MYRKEYNEHMEMKRQNGVLRNNERILREENKALTDEYMIQKHIINADFLKDYIPISVIQNKIMNLNLEIEKLQIEYEKEVVNAYKQVNLGKQTMLSEKVKLLQELLEERE